jgi:predicted ATPase
MKIRRFIFTGTPGSGKTTVINQLNALGYTTLAEVATELIQAAQLNHIERPWDEPRFIKKIFNLQLQRLEESLSPLQFYDRSPFCSLALLDYLFPPPKEPLLRQQIEKKLTRLIQEKIFQPTVFFFDQLETIEQNAIRQISYEEAQRFEDLHIKIYERFGFTLHRLKPMPIESRVDEILKFT